jgi:protein CpxP
MNTRFTIWMGAGLMAVALAGGAYAESALNNAAAIEQDQPQARRGPGGPGFGGPRRGPGGPGFDFRGLDLTDDQRAQLRKIREAHQDEFRAVGEKMRAAREGMRTLIEAETINESAIRAKSSEVAAAEADMAILNAKVRAESMQILTSEQQAKLKEQRSQQGPMRKRGPRPPQQ